jgi:hypothetical protein
LCQLVDLDGKGVSSIIAEQGNGEKFNQGNGEFGLLRPVAAKPSLANPSFDSFLTQSYISRPNFPM